MTTKLRKERGDLEAAAYVYWGETIPIITQIKETNPDKMFDTIEVPMFVNIEEQDSRLQDENTPETLLIDKDTVPMSLSKECLLMAKAIMNLPEEMFLTNGKIKKMKLRKLIKEQTGWSVSKIERVKDNLAQQLIDIHNGEELLYQK